MKKHWGVGLVLMILVCAAVGAQEGQSPPRLNIVGVMGLSFGAWVPEGTKMEEWLPQARMVCSQEDFCRINVFVGEEHVTHEDPVPEENLEGLGWVFEFEKGGSPAVVVEEAHAEPGKEKKRWTFDE